MKIISIAGTTSNIGKTTVAESIIHQLTVDSPEDMDSSSTNVSALKITTRHSGNCSKTSCGVCDSIKYPFVIIDDISIIDQPGKDTSRLKNAGAQKVIWLLSYPETLKDGIKAALEHFDNDATVIVEGNSFLIAHEADLSVLVVRPGRTGLKESAKLIIDKIDIALVNVERGAPPAQLNEIKQWLEELGSKADVIEFDPKSFLLNP